MDKTGILAETPASGHYSFNCHVEGERRRFCLIPLMDLLKIIAFIKY